MSKNVGIRLQHCFLRFNIKPSILQADQSANQAYFEYSDTHTNNASIITGEYESNRLNNTAVGGAILDEILLKFN